MYNFFCLDGHIHGGAPTVAAMTGKYTVTEVGERTGVPAATLRQWERRYGFPAPERTPGGYRLYSEADISAILVMKSHIDDGVPASRAAELVGSEGADDGPRSAERLRHDLLEALTKLDETGAAAVLGEAHALHPVETVILEVIAPTLVEIGEMWHAGRMRVSTEHFASSYLYGRLRYLLSLSGQVMRGPAVIVACAPLERHELGALILSLMLRRAGYRVYFLGADTPLEDLRELAARIHPVAVMISAATAGALEQLLDKSGYLQGLAPHLLFGGGAFNERPEVAATLGGSYLTDDAGDAVKKFQALQRSQPT